MGLQISVSLQYWCGNPILAFLLLRGAKRYLWFKDSFSIAKVAFLGNVAPVTWDSPSVNITGASILAPAVCVAVLTYRYSSMDSVRTLPIARLLLMVTCCRHLLFMFVLPAHHTGAA